MVSRNMKCTFGQCTGSMSVAKLCSPGKTKVGGLGYVANNPDGCIQRGIGRNVKANRIKTDKTLPGYYTLGCMQNALRPSKEVYKPLVAPLHRK